MTGWLKDRKVVGSNPAGANPTLRLLHGYHLCGKERGYQVFASNSIDYLDVFDITAEVAGCAVTLGTLTAKWCYSQEGTGVSY